MTATAVDPSRVMMPNIYYLGFKTGQAIYYISSLFSTLHNNKYNNDNDDDDDQLPPMDQQQQQQPQFPSFHQILVWIKDFPKLYGHWWWNLVRKDPIHVLIETTLVVSIIYILVARSKDWKDTQKEHLLSAKEEEELLREWKLHGRAPLTPRQPSPPTTTTTAEEPKQSSSQSQQQQQQQQQHQNGSLGIAGGPFLGRLTHSLGYHNHKHNNNNNNSNNNNNNHQNNNTGWNASSGVQPLLVVHKVHGPFMDISLETDTTTATTAAKEDDEANHATSTITTRASKSLIGSKFLSSVHSHNNNKQQQQQQQQLQQQHLHNDKNHSTTTMTTPTTSTTTTTTTTMTMNREQILTVLNFGTFDYLGMSSTQPSVRAAADRALTRYGCGACGPRGFYGTIDVHLQLEQSFASFLKVDGAILYSDGASTCASTVAAFCKRGDLIVCDEGIGEPLRTGVTLSRAHVKWFQHNDMTDLRRVLQSVQQSDEKMKRPTNAQRRFIIVEGLYRGTGQIVPLQELVALKHEFSYRLLLDESNSFGTLGATGRGVHELFQCRLMHDIEITTIALEHAMGAIGGITVGTEEVVEHQRLSGSGYCFSASSPPFTAAAALQSLHLLQQYPETTLYPLQDNIAYMYYKLTQLCHEQLDDVLWVTSSSNSPIFFLQVADIPETRDLDQVLLLQEVVQECLVLEQPITVVTTQTTSIPKDDNHYYYNNSNGKSSLSLSSSSKSSNHDAPPVGTTTSSSSLTDAPPAQQQVTSAANHSTAPTTTTTTIHGMVLMAIPAPAPAIRITVSAAHTHEQLDQCLRIFTDAVENVLSRTSQY